MFYHGAHTRFAIHPGLCITDDRDAAEVYASFRGEIATLEIDLSGLRVVEVAGYDHDSNTAAGDDGATVDGADVLVFGDADERGRQHRTWRLMTAAAVARVVVVSVDDV